MRNCFAVLFALVVNTKTSVIMHASPGSKASNNDTNMLLVAVNRLKGRTFLKFFAKKLYRSHCYCGALSG